MSGLVANVLAGLCTVVQFSTALPYVAATALLAGLVYYLFFRPLDRIRVRWIYSTIHANRSIC